MALDLRYLMREFWPTHEKPGAERYAGLGNYGSLLALEGTTVSKPRRVLAEWARLPERSHASPLPFRSGFWYSPGFTHQRSEVERYAESGNFKASLALRNVPVSKPRRVVVGQVPLPERLDA